MKENLMVSIDLMGRRDIKFSSTTRSKYKTHETNHDKTFHVLLVYTEPKKKLPLRLKGKSTSFRKM